MNKDFRVSVGFFENIKTIKLQKKLGSDGVICLLKLWRYAAVHKPDGILTDMDEEDIEIVVGWTGEPGVFVDVITQEKSLFLIKNNGTFEIHDWIEHNGYAAHAKDRSEAARKAVEARWNKARESEKSTESIRSVSTESIRSVYEENTGRTPTTNSPSPSPTPTPIPNPNPNPNPTPTTTEPPYELVDELIQSCMKVSSSSKAQFTSTVRFLQQMYHECPEVVERALMHFQANSNGKWKAGTLTDICRKKAEEIIQEQDSKPKPIEDELEQYKRSKILEEFDKRIRDFPNAPDPKLYITNRENYRSIHNRESVQIIGKEQWQKYSNLLKSKGIDPKNPPRGQPIGKTA